MTKRKRPLALSEVYRLLEPGPVVLVSTSDGERNDVMPMSWHTMMEFEPPLVGCVISGRNHTFDLLTANRECVINVPTAELLRKVVGCGNVSGARVDKFARFGLTPAAAAKVKAPLVEECWANLECRLHDARWVARYNFFVLEVVKGWIAPGRRPPATIHHRGRGVFMIAGRTVRVPSKAR